MLVGLLFLASLAFPPPVTANQKASPQIAPPAAATSQVTPSDEGDVFHRTNRYFQTCKSKAEEVEAQLRTLQTESVAASPGDKAKQQAVFLKKLTARYPGATFDGASGSVPIRERVVAQFTDSLKVESIKESSQVILEYLVTRDRILVTADNNSITVLVDRYDPARSTFINVSIPAIKAEAEKIIIDPDRKRFAGDTAETFILNDAYQLLSLTSSQRMDIFAANIIRDPKSQQELLKIAGKNYRERHPQEYQAVDPALKKTKKIDSKPNKPADRRFYEGFIKLFFLILSMVGVIWTVFVGIRTLKSNLNENVQKRRKNQYYTLTPMVRRALNHLGGSLWGRNLPWAKNYNIQQRSDRWLLSQGKEVKVKPFKITTRIEVCLRGAYFKIKITQLNGAEISIDLACNGLSERELRRRLQDVRLELTKHLEPDYNADPAA